MSFRLQNNTSSLIYSFAFVFVVIVVIRRSFRATELDVIPTVGSSSWLGSWWAGITFLRNAQNVIQEGYDMYKPAPFKVAEGFHWRVILSDRKHLEELSKASDDKLSSWHAIHTQLHLDDTLGPQSRFFPNYFPFIDSGITRNLGVICTEIRDEMVDTFAEILDLEENEWKGFSAVRVAEAITSRVSNRVFFGLPLCRDPDWIRTSEQCANDLVKWGITIGIFPKFVRAPIVRCFTRIPQSIAHCVKLLHPIIEQRQKYQNNYGNKPNNLKFLSFLMEEMDGPGNMTVERMAISLLGIGIGGIFTTSNSFTQALFYLAANPQYIRPLREEVESVVGKYGWSKASLGKMGKVDSFLMECQRIRGVSTASLQRTVLKDFTFSDGTFIPKGTLIAAASRLIHRDENFYESPDEFKPFRFVNMREGEEEDPKYKFVTNSLEFLIFGHGRHTCPGRFLAITEMKLMLAHIVVTYDVKLEDNKTMPPSLHFGIVTAADPHAKIMFRNRVD